jgi:hypothetical protein
MAGSLKLLAGLVAGYVLGARAGRERYERIAEATRRLAEAGPAAGEDHGETGSPPSQAGEAEASGRAGSGPSPGEPAPSRTGRERSRSGR